MVSTLCYHVPHWHVKPQSCRAIEERDKINIAVQWWRYQARNHELSTSTLQRTNTAECVCVCVCPDILNTQRKLDIMPIKTTTRRKENYIFINIYIVMAFTLFSWAKKLREPQPAFAVWSKSCWLWVHCKFTSAAWVQQGWEHGQWLRGGRNGFSIQLIPGKVWAGN